MAAEGRIEVGKISPAYVKKQLPDIVAAKNLWTPLYPVEGGRAQGFKCNIAVDNPVESDHRFLNACNRVTRTERGMKSHLWTVHRIKPQQAFDFDGA